MYLHESIDVDIKDIGADLGRGCRIKYRRDVDRSTFDSFANGLKESGAYNVISDREIGDNRYVTLSNSHGMLHLYYIAFDRTVRIISDTLEFNTLPVYEENEFEKIGDCELCVMSLDFSHRHLADGNGLSYVVILPDGRYFILDGGYPHDAVRLKKFLVDNNKRPDGKVVIAAWAFTHSHPDHVGCFENFAENYADDVELQYVIANPIPQTEFLRGIPYHSYLAEKMPLDVEKFLGDTKFIKPHTGQIMKLASVEFEVMYTGEDFYPRMHGHMNNTTVALRMKTAETSVLFMGDCELDASNTLCDRVGDALKSDFIQVNHHGYSGATVELYNKVKPSYAMFTTSNLAFTIRTCGVKYEWIGNAVESNKYIFDTLGRENIFTADGPVEIIRLPLTDKEKDIRYYNFE